MQRWDEYWSGAFTPKQSSTRGTYGSTSIGEQQSHQTQDKRQSGNTWCQRARSRAAFISMAVWHKVQYATGIGNSQMCIATWKNLQRVSFSVITLGTDPEATVDGRRGGLRHHHLMMNCRAYKYSTSISTTLVYLCPPSTHLLLRMRVFSSSCLCTAIYTTKHLGKLFIDDQPQNNHLLGLQWLHVLHTLNSGLPPQCHAVCLLS